jgi:hypothetical protein
LLIITQGYSHMVQKTKDKNHQLAIAARERVTTIIDQISPEDLVNSIKRAPSLRGMILGYIAEEMFQRHILYQVTGNSVRSIGVLLAPSAGSDCRVIPATWY